MLTLQPLTAAAAACILWMAASIVVRTLRRSGLMAPADEVHMPAPIYGFPLMHSHCRQHRKPHAAPRRPQGCLLTRCPLKKIRRPYLGLSQFSCLLTDMVVQRTMHAIDPPQTQHRHRCCCGRRRLPDMHQQHPRVHNLPCSGLRAQPHHHLLRCPRQNTGQSPILPRQQRHTDHSLTRSHINTCLSLRRQRR